MEECFNKLRGHRFNHGALPHIAFLRLIALASIAGPAVAVTIPIIETIAGAKFGGMLPCNTTALAPRHVARGADGIVYVADSDHFAVRRIWPNGSTDVFAGGQRAQQGTVDEDGCPATLASFGSVVSVHMHAGSSSVYVVDSFMHSVRRIDPSGTIELVAGGFADSTPDDIPATSSGLFEPMDVLVGAGGDFFIADRQAHSVKYVNASGFMFTVAGNGSDAEPVADGALADERALPYPRGLALHGNWLYIVSDYLHQVVRLDLSTKRVYLYVGDGQARFYGDGGPPLAASLQKPSGVAATTTGALYIADTQNHRIRYVQADGAPIITVAGSGTSGFTGDGLLATQSALTRPSRTALSADESVLYISDDSNFRIRRLYLKGPYNGTMDTLCGNGNRYSGGDGGLASVASFFSPRGVAASITSSDLYVADTYGYTVRRISSDGVITAVAGTTVALSTSFLLVESLALAMDGSLYIVDRALHRVHRLFPNGTLAQIAGSGHAGISIGGQLAVSANLSSPSGIAVSPSGDVFVAELGSSRVLIIDTNGTLNTYAGNGTAGYSGDDEPATEAQLSRPGALALGNDGSLFIADVGNYRIRVVDADLRTIRTFAGSGDGDGGGCLEEPKANSVCIPALHGLAVDGGGVLYYSTNNMVRRILDDGQIQTVAGQAEAAGDGPDGAPKGAALDGPSHLSLDAQGRLYIADTNNGRIRRVSGLIGVSPTPSATPSATSSPSVTPSMTSTPSVTSTGTSSSSASASATATGSSTGTSSPTASSSATATTTSTASASVSHSPTSTAGSTGTPTTSASSTATPRPSSHPAGENRVNLELELVRNSKPSWAPPNSVVIAHGLPPALFQLHASVVTTAAGDVVTPFGIRCRCRDAAIPDRESPYARVSGFPASNVVAVAPPSWPLTVFASPVTSPPVASDVLVECEAFSVAGAVLTTVAQSMSLLPTSWPAWDTVIAISEVGMARMPGQLAVNVTATLAAACPGCQSISATLRSSDALFLVASRMAQSVQATLLTTGESDLELTLSGATHLVFVALNASAPRFTVNTSVVLAGRTLEVIGASSTGGMLHVLSPAYQDVCPQTGACGYRQLALNNPAVPAASTVGGTLSCPPWCGHLSQMLPQVRTSGAVDNGNMSTHGFPRLVLYVPSNASSASRAIWASYDSVPGVTTAPPASSIGIYYTSVCAGFTDPTSGACTLPGDSRSSMCAFGVGDSCAPCPRGAVCPGGVRAWPLPGWYTTGESTGALVECAAPALERCRGWNASAAVTECGDSYVRGSIGCAVCARGYYVETDGACTACPASSTIWDLARPVLIAASVLAAVLLCLFAIIVGIVRLAGGTVKGGARRMATLSVWTLTAVQLMAQAGRSIGPSLPGWMRMWFVALLSFQFEGVTLPSGCVPGYPFLNEVATFAVVLGLLPVATALSWRVVPGASIGRTSDAALRAALTLLALTYSLTANSAVRLLVCDDVTLPLFAALQLDGGAVAVSHLRVGTPGALVTVRVMRADPSRVCYVSSHLPAAILAWLTLVVYLVLFPILVVWWARRCAVRALLVEHDADCGRAVVGNNGDSALDGAGCNIAQRQSAARSRRSIATRVCAFLVGWRACVNDKHGDERSPPDSKFPLARIRQAARVSYVLGAATKTTSGRPNLRAECAPELVLENAMDTSVLVATTPGLSVYTAAEFRASTLEFFCVERFAQLGLAVINACFARSASPFGVYLASGLVAALCIICAFLYATRWPFPAGEAWKLFIKVASFGYLTVVAMLNISVAAEDGHGGTGSLALAMLAFVYGVLLLSALVVGFGMSSFQGAVKEQVAQVAAASFAKKDAAARPMDDAFDTVNPILIQTTSTGLEGDADPDGPPANHGALPRSERPISAPSSEFAAARPSLSAGSTLLSAASVRRMSYGPAIFGQVQARNVTRRPPTGTFPAAVSTARASGHHQQFQSPS